MIRHISLFLLTALFGSTTEAADFSASNLNDSGAGSLRQAILDANGAPGADVVNFAVDGSIVLGSTLPPITDPAGLTIDGMGRSITVSGNNAVRVMIIEAGAQLNLRHLTVANGWVDSLSEDGGGIENLGSLNINGCTFADNRAAFGGGINNDGILTVTDSRFTGNYAGWVGGGINSLFSSNSTKLTVTNSTFFGNLAFDFGGGIAGGEVVSNSTFSNNSATWGGGIYVVDTVTNSTFTGNHGSSVGGAIREVGTVSNSTFSSNSAASGGAIYNADTVINSTIYSNISFEGALVSSASSPIHLANTILANNTGLAENTGGDCAAGTAVSPSGVNLVQDGSCGASSDPVHFIVADPNLGPLADNGGPTQTHALLPGSPAIDTGDNSICAAQPVNNLDQRGVARPQGVFCDIGAFELAQTPTPGIETLISFFDQSIANGGLIGIGPGKSAQNRPTALRNKLLTAGAFIDQNTLLQACQQLKSSLKRIDTGGAVKPAEFVTGTAASDLVQMIQDLRQELGCGKSGGKRA
jgi:predicted outer membrane repeat protein